MPSHSKPAWKTPPVTPDKPLHEILRSARQGQTKSTIGDLPSYSREVRDTVTKHEENQDENRVDAGRMASRLRAEAQLASSLFSGEDARKTALNQLQEKTKQSNSKQLGSFHRSVERSYFIDHYDILKYHHLSVFSISVTFTNLL